MKPVLVIVFNRPEETAELLRRLSEIRPDKLYVAADGPRKDSTNDKNRCLQTRALFDDLSWPCNVERNFRADNLGCKNAVSSAITWFFGHEEAGIILEDDCIPEPSFFDYCASVLDLYANDTRIGHVGGFNCQVGNRRGDGAYYFSRYFHVWGWATWRRAWRLYDADMSDYEEFRRQDVLRTFFPDPEVRQVWEQAFEMVSAGKIDTWDYQWVYTNIKNNMLAVVPNVNLIRNIGFNENATHTKGHDPNIAGLTTGEFVLNQTPSFVAPSFAGDRFTYTTHMNVRLRKERPPLKRKRGFSILVRWTKAIVHRIKMTIKFVLVSLRVIR